MRLRILGLLIFSMLLALLAGGCGEDAETDMTLGASEVPDPCELVTKSDIEAIMGEPFGDPSRSEEEGKKSCSYTSVAQPPRVADIQIIKPCSMVDYSNYAASDDSEPVHAIGMHANWNKKTKMLSVHTYASACLFVSGGGNPRGADPADDQPAIANARKVGDLIIEKMGPE